jgi:hypothetical protein
MDKSNTAPGGNGPARVDRTLPIPSHRNAPPGTSDEAARRIAPAVTGQRRTLLSLLIDAGPLGLTDAELETLSGFRSSTVTPRRGELRRLRLIVDSGVRRPTPRGRMAAVWTAVPDAAALAGLA